MVRQSAFFMNGGAGRHISSIPALELYAKENPDDDFIVSPLIGEEPDLGIIIKFTPKHSALLIIAPKFFVSVTPSSNKIKIELFFFKSFSKSFNKKVFTGDIEAIIPW